MTAVDSKFKSGAERLVSPASGAVEASPDSSAMETDVEWEKWATQDPYYSVITDPKFRSDRLTDAAKTEFFASGTIHVDYVLNVLKSRFDAGFTPRRILDFGCGVGRLVIPFAKIAQEVVGVDISATMLTEAHANSSRHAVTNCSYVKSDDELSAVYGSFDLVHSVIVLQHIPIARGRALFALLLRRVAPGGCGAIQVTFGWDAHPETYGSPPAAATLPTPEGGGIGALARAGLKRLLGRELPSAHGKSVAGEAPDPIGADPEMQMNFYNLSELMFLLQREGIQQVHTEFTDHGGALGAFMFFQRPAVM